MEEKKAPLHELERYEQLEPRTAVLIGMEDCKRRPLSSCILFLLLGVFVFTLGCFAVYTALSVGAVKKVADEGAPTAKPLFMDRDDYPQEPVFTRPKSNFQFEISINGKKIVGGGENKTEILIQDSDKPKTFDEFSNLRNFLKKFTGSDGLDRPVEDRDESAEDKQKKPKVIIQSWEFRRLPSDAQSPIPLSPFGGLFDSPRDSFGDILDGIFSPLRKLDSSRKPADNGGEMIIIPLSSGIIRDVPSYNKVESIAPSKKDESIPALKKDENEVPLKNQEKPSKKEDDKSENKATMYSFSQRNAFPNTIFKDFQGILDGIFDDKPNYSNENKEVPQKSTAEPLEDAEVFKKMEGSYLDRYQKIKGIPREEATYSEGPFNIFGYPDQYYYNDYRPPMSPQKPPKKYMPEEHNYPSTTPTSSTTYSPVSTTPTPSTTTSMATTTTPMPTTTTPPTTTT